MSFYKSNKEEAAKAEGGNHINGSGIFDVTILAAFVDTNDKGARTVNFYVDHNGTPQVVYGGLKLDNNDGSPNFAAAIFNKLCVVADLDDVTDPEEDTLPIGKNKSDKDVAVLPDFSDLDVKMRVQMEYSVYNGKIMEKKVIKGFYRADGASADEIINETEVGVKLEKDLGYADNVTYKDDLDAEQIAKWIAGGRDNATGAAAATSAKPKASFGKKSFGNK